MLAIQRFTLLGLIDAAFRLYREHFGVLIIISLIVNVPVLFTNLGLTFLTGQLEGSAAGVGADGSGMGPMFAMVAAMGGMALVTLVVSFIGGAIAMAMSTDVANQAALGQTPTLDHAFVAAKRYFAPVLVAAVLQGLLVGVGMLFCIVPGVIAAIGLILVSPVIMIEGASPIEALSRSWQLTEGRRLKIFGIYVLLGVLMVGISVVASLLTILNDSLAMRLVQATVSQLVSAVFSPLWYVMPVLVFYDAKVEREAFDVQVLSQLNAQG